MKKKSIILFVVVVMLLTVGYAKESNASVTTGRENGSESGKLEFPKTSAYYVMSGFGEEFHIFRFDSPNDGTVIYQISDSQYLVAKDAGKTGMSYANLFLEDAHLLALSDKYFLFLTEEGKVAVSFKEKKDTDKGKILHDEIPFDKLSDEEKNAFIYPVSYEKVLNEE